MKPKKTNDGSGLDERAAFQKNEEYKTVKNELPADTFNADKQIVNAAQIGVESKAVEPTPVSKPVVASAAEPLKKRIQIRPTSETAVVKDSSVGGVPLGEGVVVASAAGLAEKSPVSDTSKIPYTAGGMRPEGRYGKSIAQTNFDIDNTASEQVRPQVDELVGINKSGDKLMGYNGTPIFSTARGKKNAGVAPQSLLFERSADLILHDETIYSSGQILDDIPAESDYPTLKAVEGAIKPETVGSDEGGQVMHKSNYEVERFKFTLTGGKLSAVGFDEVQFKPGAEKLVLEKSNTNWLVDSNNVAASVLRMQRQLGREVTEKWSPLGYVISQPYQYNMLMHDIESTLGAFEVMAYRATVSSYGYQLNMLAKDGSKPIAPAVEMFLGGIFDLSKSAVCATESSDANPLAAAGIGRGNGSEDGSIFNRAFYKIGSAAAMYHLNDSPAKYNSKADFHTSSRGPKVFMQSIDNNIFSSHCKKEFINALNVAHTFSTWDGTYSSVLPIYVTKRIHLRNPLSLNYFLQSWSRDAVTPDNPSGTVAKYAYQYNDRMNRYYMPVKHPLVEGILVWLIKHEAALAKVYGDNATIDMPATFDMTNPTMFSLIICAASQEIAMQRNIYFRDIVWAGDNSEYIWPDLASLKDVNPLWSDQLTMDGYAKPLKLGRLNKVGRVRMVWGETFQAHGEQVGEGVDLVMPWYMSEACTQNTYALYTGFADEKDTSAMSVPSVRAGVNHEYVDFLREMEPRELRLSLDQLTSIPLYTTKSTAISWLKAVYSVGHGTGNVSSINASIHVKAIRYDSNSDGRLEVAYDSDLSYAAIACTPRELGFIEPGAPVGYQVVKGIALDGTVTEISDPVAIVDAYDKAVDGSTTFKLISYAARGSNNDARTVTRTGALYQEWVACYARRDADIVINANMPYTTRTGLLPAISCLLSAGSLSTLSSTSTSIDGVYELGSTNLASDVQTHTFMTLSRVIWTILQRVYFCVNPFENCFNPDDAGSDAKAGAYVDPIETSFWFGVCGFLAADYDLDVNERSNDIQSLGLGYIKDNFIKDSPIFNAR